jgi:hypothetical protein
MNLIIKKTFGALLALQAANVLAGTGNLFNVTTGGAALGQTVSYTLCLTINGKNPLSCQNYNTSNATLTIKTTAPHHTYHYAGIKVNTPGYTYTAQGLRDSTRAQFATETVATGYTFIGTVSDTHAATGTVSPTGGATTTLSVSITDLALSISGLTLNGQASGQPRTITITNTGGAEATALNIDYPTWPAATTAVDDCGATLAAGAACTITVTPNTTPTTSCSTTGIAPTPGVITIGAGNATDVTSNVVVLNYGCIYQGGYLFAMTEAADTAESIGGTVVTQVDQAARDPNGVFWSSDAAGTSTVVDIIYGISETSTTEAANPNTDQVDGQSACNGATDGSCNSNNIITYYSPPTTDPAITPSFYAAGRCTETISGYSDWYLPAICEMGPASNGSGCAVGTQNIITQLGSLVGDPGAGTPGTSCTYAANCLAGYYWSSTEGSFLPQFFAWEQYFDSVGGSVQDYVNKDIVDGVRCVRVLTP